MRKDRIITEDFYVDDKTGQEIINQIMNSEAVKEKKDKYPVNKNNKILNFEGLIKKEFSDVSFNYYKITDLFGDLQIEEAKFKSNYTPEAYEYFYYKNNKITPYIYYIDEHRYNKEFITELFSILNPPIDSFSIVQEYDEKQLRLQSFVLLLEQDLILFYEGDMLTFYINPNKHFDINDKNPFYNIMCVLNSYITDKYEKNKIHIVYKSDFGFDKIAFDVKHIDINIDDNYNDDFKPVSDSIINSLNDESKTGLYMLDGAPGTGKTTFLRYLAGKIIRNIIFVSPDMVDYITDPSFIPFLMSNSDSVLIIEDAEPALQKRDGTGRTGAISNILNLTDGLLSDCLNISIVATFNTSTKNLDEALLRDGRLIKGYTFDKLSVVKSNKLLKKLGHKDTTNVPMTLSEIYFYGKDNKSGLYKNTKKIGFGK